MLPLFNLFSSGSIMLMQAAAVLLVIAALANATWLSWVRRNAQMLLFVVFLASMVGSLLYEFAFHFPPCELCWYQRIFIYSSTILLGRALIIKKSALGEVLTLSVFGLVFAIYHNIMDIFRLSSLSFCGTGAEGGSLCLIRYVYEFGYITIPMMSLTVLILGVILALLGRNPQPPIGKK